MPPDDTVSTVPPPSSEETIMSTGGAPARRSDAPLSRGELLGRYVVLERLGQGAMGIVYKAFDPELDRAVALKLLIGEGTETGRARLTREAQAMARVSHPNVIAVHDVGTHDGRVFFAMELVDGTPLGDWREVREPSVTMVLDVFRQAGAGIAAAHAAGIVHRDFKPDNVLVDATGRVRVLDFGLARRGADEVADSDHALEGPVDLTRTGAVLGTPAYMAPEQFSGAAAPKPRSRRSLEPRPSPTSTGVPTIAWPPMPARKALRYSSCSAESRKPETPFERPSR